MAYTDIDDPSVYFQTTLYTGNATDDTAITHGGNSDLQADWIWIKNRTASGEGHHLYDSVRGVTKRIRTDTAAAESTVNDALKSFDSDGFTVDDRAGVNQNTIPIASWNWKAGTSFTNDASSTSIGTIDSTGSVNTDAGFSIISFTANGSNATIAHGLGVAPKMIILKNRSISKYWATYHASLGEGKAIFLDTTAAADADNTYWNNTAPTSTTFSFGTNSGNNNGNNMIAYCFAEKQGYSKFASYIGNGNANGTFIPTGFKPAFTLFKKTNATSEWFLLDGTRDPFNPVKKVFEANSDSVEATDPDIDYLSNGFKIRTTNGNLGTNASTYIFMAFAENPFVTSTGIPTTAR